MQYKVIMGQLPSLYNLGFITEHFAKIFCLKVARVYYRLIFDKFLKKIKIWRHGVHKHRLKSEN